MRATPMLTFFRAAPTVVEARASRADGQDHAEHADQRAQHHHDLQIGDVQSATDDVLFGYEELQDTPGCRAGA